MSITEDLIAAQIAKSIDGSLTVRPPTTLTNTSLFPKNSLPFLDITAQSISNRGFFIPFATLLNGPTSLSLSTTRAWTSTNTTLEPWITALIALPEDSSEDSRKSNDGFFTSFRPFPSISNTPISFVEPKRFFMLLIILYWLYWSPSIYKTQSTTCSNTFGPATSPLLFICPTTKIGIPVLLAALVSNAPQRRTCPILPGKPLDWIDCILWIESTTTSSKLPPSIKATTFSTVVSSVTIKLSLLYSFFTVNLSSLSINWEGDSSPQTYRTLPFSQKFKTIFIKSVDFPTPGSPLSRITSPGTIPFPKTRSNSKEPVVILPLDVLLFLFFENSVILLYFEGTTFFSVWEIGKEDSSTSSREPHSPHEGHLPAHLRNSELHALQTYFIYFFFNITKLLSSNPIDTSTNSPLFVPSPLWRI